MTWDQYWKMLLFVIAAACVASPVLKKPGVLVVMAVLYILGRLWLVGPGEDQPLILRGRKRKGPPRDRP